MNPEIPSANPIILFDGVCNLCSGAVQWILLHDEKRQFRFASLQSEIGLNLRKKYQIGEEVDSIILVEKDKAYISSAAALRIARRCDGAWKMLYIFMIVPAFIRNWIYRIIAKNRYRWFGKKESCWLPDPALQELFLEKIR